MTEEIKPYATADNKEKQVEQMFDGIAPHYDLLNHMLSFGIDKRWRRKAISLLSGTRLRELLDVATGTGDMALLAHDTLKTKVVGCDISDGMIKKAIEKVQSKNLQSEITFFRADSTQLPFSSNRFDAITVAFGVRNFAQLDKGLSEMQRVLRPGGNVVILEFSTPTNTFFRAIYTFYFRHVLPLIGGFISSDRKAYEYLFRSAMAFPCGADFERHLEMAGLQPISTTQLTLGIATAYLAKKK